MALICLSTAREVAEALDGIPGMEIITSEHPKTISNWLTVYGSFPPRHMAKMVTALHDRGKTAPAVLWRQVGAEGVTLVPGMAAAYSAGITACDSSSATP